MELIDTGRGDREIAEMTGVPRGSVSAWRNGHGQSYRRLATATPAWRPRDPGAYCYLLGIYLGDGCLDVRSPGSAYVVVTLDAVYPGIVDEVRGKLRVLFPLSPVSGHMRMGGSVSAVQISDPALPFALPHHGRGRKHERPIRLSSWQRELTAQHPQQLLRGLIHSDGCRCINRFKTRLPSGRVAEYEYPRYFFSNLSEDIRGIFCEHCELLGIRWTQSNPRNISISHRRSVARLDEFIGPKY